MHGKVAGVVENARAGNAVMQRRHFGDNGAREADPRGWFSSLYCRDPSQAYAEKLRLTPAKDAGQRRQQDIELEELERMKGHCKVRCIEERVRHFEGLEA